MEIQLNDYHKKVNAQKMASMAYWREHPLPLEECLPYLDTDKARVRAKAFDLQSNNAFSEKQWFSNPVAACCR